MKHETYLCRLSAWLHPSLYLKAEESHDDESISIWSTKAIVSGQLVAKIPKSSIISYRTSSFPLQLEDNLNPSLRLVLVILYELSLANQSKWSDYLSALPFATIDIALLWFSSPSNLASRSTCEKAHRWLQGTEVDRFVTGLEINLTTLEEFYQTHVLPLQNELENYSISFDHYLKVYSIISSRAFLIDNYHSICLIPLFDLFNHSDSSSHQVQLHVDSYWVCQQCGKVEGCVHDDEDAETADQVKVQVFDLGKARGDGKDHLNGSFKRAKEQTLNDQEEDHLEMISTSLIESDEQVFNTYGRLGNAELLTLYGFLIQGNADDRIHFDLVRFEPEEMEDWIDVLKKTADGNELISFEKEEEGDEGNNKGDLWIDADARMSPGVWIHILLTSGIDLRGSEDDRKCLLYGLAKEIQIDEEDGQESNCSDRLDWIRKAIHQLVSSHIAKQYRSELTSQELLSLIDEGVEKRERLAIEYLAIERGLLETWLAVLGVQTGAI